MRDLKKLPSFKKKIRNFKKMFLILNKLRFCKKKYRDSENKRNNGVLSLNRFIHWLHANSNL